MEKMQPANRVDCVFMLAPMSDRYIDLILGALAKLDTSRLTAKTGRLGTLYSGAPQDVANGFCGCFALAQDPAVHMTLEAMLTAADASCECNPKTDADWTLPHFTADSRCRIFPGKAEGNIPDVETEAKAAGLYHGEDFGYTVLKGDIAGLAAFYGKLSAALRPGDSLQVTLSVNSPTAE